MSGIFDRLQRQLDIKKREQGISPLELADLPSDLRKIMRLMLREVVIKYSDLCVAVEAMPEKNRLNQTELDMALSKLVEQNWLIAAGEGEFLSYRVNLRRKAGSSLDQDIWAALNARISGPTAPTKPENQDTPGSQ